MECTETALSALFTKHTHTLIWFIYPHLTKWDKNKTNILTNRLHFNDISVKEFILHELLLFFSDWYCENKL